MPRPPPVPQPLPDVHARAFAALVEALRTSESPWAYLLRHPTPADPDDKPAFLDDLNPYTSDVEVPTKICIGAGRKRKGAEPPEY